ncbi:fimbria/pilus outer membrane usher protein [Nitratireductor pacificus]|uniref:Fimbrial biogenesis outer membrane usher protein n=1 Tax=Nitratireductor pacificus pht-3B TaxID=391937 RepID=K2M5A8_9HYPH|nr:fimbria/pilus outer membrane usher protein [Nitratireductor pacificus]EKF17326.1 fimbrial biogenesis outer membrane usher protein [Nitratireductor pacificus pht-3B]
MTIAVACGGLPAVAQEQPRADRARAPVDVIRDLYLEVFINDASTRLIGHFKELADGGLAATRGELREVGLNAGGAAGNDEELVRLDTLPGVVVAYDEAAQGLFVTASNASRAEHVVDIAPAPAEGRKPTASGFGAVLNYALFASSNTLSKGDGALLKGISGSFEARLFSPYGTVSQSFVAGYTDGELDGFRRLATSWTYSDPARLITYRAGDLVTGGLPWTRPVYLGGLQVRRNFALRPDLVTLPLPAFSGTAAVPSTLEVYTRNARSYSGDLAEGPFRLVNLPAVAGAGSARIVLRDLQGRESTVTLPFYASTMLLRKGLLDFSAEIGFPRRDFGTNSDGYDDELMGSVSARYGLADWLTLEGHLEGGAELVNGGVGAAFPLGAYGAASFAAAGSAYRGETGFLASASVELGFEGWTLRGRIQRTFGDYQDIASVTARPEAGGEAGLARLSAGVPRAIDQLSIGVPLALDMSNLNLSYTHLTDAAGERSRIFGLSYGQRLTERGSLYASAFIDAEDRRHFGVFAGVSFSFGKTVTASTAIEQGQDGTRLVSQLSSQERRENGSIGWRLRSAEGSRPDRSASVSYRSAFGRGEVAVQNHDEDFRFTGQWDGALAVAGGGVFATNRLDDAFAVVDVGAPGIEVRHQNRPAGRTNRHGRLLVPDLVSHEENALSFDPRDLPVDAEIPATTRAVVPASRSGVVVDFGVSKASGTALVAFVDAAGDPLPVSLTGVVVGPAESAFVVGYDGEAYLHGLEAENRVRIELADGRMCEAKFAFRPDPGNQVRIGGVPCL